MDEKREQRVFAGVMTQYVARSGYNVCQLARLSGLPRTTLVNWLEGQVKKPRAWQDVVMLAQVVRLSRTEVDELLRAAGYPPVSRLQTQSHGARRFHVEPFDEKKGEALTLFARVLGEELVARARATFAEIADLLGHLPLAVDIVACRLAYEPGWSVENLLARLRRENGRLNTLIDEERGVRMALEASYALLPPALQDFFATLGTFGGEDFSVEAAAAIANTPIEKARAHLRELFCLSLVRRGRPERYRLIPLLQTFTREKIGKADVWERMVAFFVAYTERHERDIPALDLEKNNIVAALEVAQERAMSKAFKQGMKAFLFS